MSNHVELYDGNCINMLTPRANVLMQIVHMYRHFLFAGVGLRQIADLYATLVHTSLTDDTRIQLENDIKKISLKKFSGALMWVLQKAFGMNSSFLVFSPNEKEGIYLWNEIVQGGNLGQHDKRYNTSKYSKIKGFFYITYQSFRVVSHYPVDWFWYLAYRTSQGFWKVINRYN